MERSKGRRCAACGGRLIPVVYGLPGGDAFEQQERGEIKLGGCMVGDHMATRFCRDCGTYR